MQPDRGIKGPLRSFGLAAVLSISMVIGSVSAALAQDLVLYGAGSLRRAMTEIAEAFGGVSGLKVKTEFAFSGLMRQRIEAGERVDIFTSADIGHPAKLMAEGRAVTMAMFARNALCLLSPGRIGAVTPETALDVMLRDGVKIGVYPPDTDPLGAYTVRLFEMADKLRPGSAAALKARSVVIGAHNSPAPRVTGDEEVDALIAGQLDLIIAYCSAAASYKAANEKAPGIRTALIHFPGALTVGPEYGLAIIEGARPEAANLALFILSIKGQQILQKNDFVPIALPATN